MPGQGVTTCDMHYLLDGLVPENYKVAHILGFDLFRVTNDRIAILSFYVKQLRMLVDLHDFHSFALNEISAFRQVVIMKCILNHNYAVQMFPLYGREKAPKSPTHICEFFLVYFDC